jgi:hypothetical protein
LGRAIEPSPHLNKTLLTLVKTDGTENTMHIIVLLETLDVGITDGHRGSDIT